MYVNDWKRGSANNLRFDWGDDDVQGLVCGTWIAIGIRAYCNNPDSSSDGQCCIICREEAASVRMLANLLFHSPCALCITDATQVSTVAKQLVLLPL